MSKTLRDDQIPPIRVGRQLREQLEAAAAEEGRSLSNLARRILVDFAEKRLATREQLAA
jgi:hypothetical protein